MHHLALEFLQSGDIGLARKIQLADRGDQELRVDDIGVGELAIFVPRDLNRDFPFRLFVIPARFFDCRVESDVLVETVLLGYANEICLKMGESISPRISI
jgi:hypothetical protein